MSSFGFVNTSNFTRHLPVVFIYTNNFNHVLSLALAPALAPAHDLDTLLSHAFTPALKRILALLFLKLIHLLLNTNILLLPHTLSPRLSPAPLHPQLPMLIACSPIDPLLPILNFYRDSRRLFTSPPPPSNLASYSLSKLRSCSRPYLRYSLRTYFLPHAQSNAVSDPRH